MLDDWAKIAGIVAAVVAVIGLVGVFAQLRATAAAARAQATIQFQLAFRTSQDARRRLFRTFPVHTDVLQQLVPTEHQDKFRSWRCLEDLSETEKADAEAVVNAINDVGQYVADGLSIRSALQQYHSIFVRVGALLGPFLDQRNAPRVDAAGNEHVPVRYGRRVGKLFHAGLAYHRCNPKHKGTELVLKRDSVRGEHEVVIVLVDGEGHGVGSLPGFHDNVPRPLMSWLRTWKSVVRQHERDLRR